MATGPNIVTIPLDLGMRNTGEYQPQPVGPNAALELSLNTRLGIIDGLPSKAPTVATIGTTSGNEKRVGVVASGRGKSIIFSRKANESVTGSNHSTTLPATTGLIGGTQQQNCYLPYVPITDSVVPGARGRLVGTAAVVTTADGHTWMAQQRVFGLDPAAVTTVELVVLDSSGAVVDVANVQVATAASPDGWVGLTADGNNVRVWQRKSATADVDVRSYVLTGGAIASGGATYTSTAAPIASTEATIAVHSDNHATYAWLATLSTASANSVTVTRLTVATGATTVLTLAMGTGTQNLAIRHITYGGSEYVALLVYGSDGTVRCHLIDGTAMTSTWGPISVAAGLYVSGGAVAVSFMFHPTEGNHVMAAVTSSVSGFGQPLQTNPAFTRFRSLTIAAGVLGTAVDLPWKGLITNGGWDRSSTLVTPLFGLQNWFAYTVNDLTSGNQWVSDPSAEIYRMSETDVCSMVGRFGVDTASVRTKIPAGRSNNLDQTSDGTVWMTYLDTDLPETGDYSSSSCRYVKMKAAQPTSQIDAFGTAIVGAGPAYWDGVELAEWCPTQRPVLVVDANTGAYATTPGTYTLAAVVQWEDNAGQLRRSIPSAVVTHVVAAADQPKIYVTLPTSMRSGINQESVRVILYASQAGQTALFAQPFWSISAVTTYLAEFNSITDPVVGAYSPGIYTTGDPSFPLVAQCPPSFKSVAIVGERAWGLDATNTLWPSKLKEQGIAFEFNSDLKLGLPSSAGDAFAVVEMRGSLVVLCANGAWAVTGQGPDNSLGGSDFNQPEQISDLPCTSRLATVRTSAGIFFQSGSRFAVMGGELGTTLLDDFAAISDVSYQAIHLPNTDEVIWFYENTSATSTLPTYHPVFNYKLRRFTCWDDDVVAGVSGVVMDPVTKQALFVRYVETLARMDPASIGDAPMTFATGDTRLGGDMEEADCSLQHVLVSGKRMSAHSAAVVLAQDYGESAARAETFTTSDIQSASNAVTGINSKRYTLCVGPRDGGSMRAIFVNVTFTGTGDCVRAYAITLVYSPKSGTKTDAVYKTAKR